MSDVKTCVCCGINSTHPDWPSAIELSENVHLCCRCVEAAADTVRLSQEQTPSEQQEAPKGFRPRTMLEDIKQFVVGQDDAVKTIAIAIYNHFKRINNPDTILPIQKSNILMIGPTGSGKTHIARSIAKSLGLPFCIGDATSITQSGYVGDDAESLVQMLVAAADGDLEKAATGIVFLDEVDKIAKSSSGASLTRDVSGEGVQQCLLKIIEGSEVRIAANGGRKNGASQIQTVDTRNVLFICAGAFVGLNDIVRDRLRSEQKSETGIGFGAALRTEDPYKDYVVKESDVTPDDLISFGLIPEFVGRLPVISNLSYLDRDALLRVLTEPADSLVKQYTALMKMDGIALVLDDSFLQHVADEAIKTNTGARGLSRFMENLLRDPMFYAPDYYDAGVRTLTMKVVDGVVCRDLNNDHGDVVVFNECATGTD